MPGRTWMRLPISFQTEKPLTGSRWKNLFFRRLWSMFKTRCQLSPGSLEDVNVLPGEAILFKTSNSTEGRIENGVFDEDFVYLSEKGADWCLQKGVGLVGIDYITIEKYGSKGSPVHRKILGRGIPILEGVNLKSVPAGKYTLYCFPLKIGGGEGAPVRAVLMRNLKLEIGN